MKKITNECWMAKNKKRIEGCCAEKLTNKCKALSVSLSLRSESELANEMCWLPMDSEEILKFEKSSSFWN